MKKTVSFFCILWLLVCSCACSTVASGNATVARREEPDTVQTETTPVLPEATPAVEAKPTEEPEEEAEVTIPEKTYTEAPEYPDRYWKADANSSKDSEFPTKYRTMEDAFKATEGKELPTREGMDTLFISGSGQYNADSFSVMISDIRTRTEGEICVFDLRQETHGFVNGTAVSLYADSNAGNAGLDVSAVTALEKDQLGELEGAILTLKSSSKSKKSGEATPKPGTSIYVDEVMTEQQLCESLGVRYVRIACTDHLCPENDDVDEFVAAYLALPEGTWLHFHCAAGVGRTGLFMMMADMLRNPAVPLEDIIDRQTLLGANDPRKSKSSESAQSSEKYELLKRFHAYVQAEKDTGFADSFSEWSQR